MDLRERRAYEVLGAVQDNLEAIERMYKLHMMRLGFFHGIMAGLLMGIALLGVKVLWM
jgi:hypothetical protein